MVSLKNNCCCLKKDSRCLNASISLGRKAEIVFEQPFYNDNKNENITFR